VADIGALVFKIGADIAELKDQMAKAQSTVETAMAGASKAAGIAKAALGAVGVGLSFAALKSSIEGAVNAMDELRNMSLRTGVAVEQLSALRGVAKLSGTDMEAVAASIAKLDKSLLEYARGGGSKSAEAFKALGISTTEAKSALETGDVAGIMQRISTEFTKGGQSAIAVAMAQELMGKSAAQMMPFMQELARTGQLNTKVTAEQAEQAHEYRRNLVALESAGNKWKMALAQDMLPAMQRITQAMVDAQKEGGKLYSIWIGLGGAASEAWAAIKGSDMSQLKSLQVEIDRERKILDSMSDPAQTYRYRGAQANARIKQQERVNELLTREAALSRQIAEAGGFDPKPNAPPKPLPTLTVPDAAPGRAGADSKSPYEREIERLQQEIIKVDELTRVQEVLKEIENDRYGKLTVAQKNNLIAYAAQVDLTREDVRVQKEAKDAVEKTQREADARLRSEAERLNHLRDQYIEMADPLEKYRKQLADVDVLLEKGLLTQQQAMEAQWKINEAMDKTWQKNEEAAKDTMHIWKQLGGIFERTFESAVSGGNKFSNVLANLASDLSRLFMRKTVMEPAGQMFESALKRFDFGSIFGDLFRAEGGPVSANSPYIVGEQGPELFVPGASGSIVPNGQFGGGGRGAPVVIVQNMSFGSEVSRGTLMAWGEAIKQQTMSLVADQVTRGGAFAASFR
jgi:hypothetical protein